MNERTNKLKKDLIGKRKGEREKKRGKKIQVLQDKEEW
jgi:hypothetical protein